MRQVVEQTARRSIRSVNGAKETPTLWKQLTDSCSLELGEETTTVNHAEVRDESVEVNLFSNDGVTGSLLQIETRGTDQVTGGEEVFECVTDVFVGSLDNSAQEVTIESLVGELATVGAHCPVSGEGAKRSEPFLNTFLENHSVKESTKQDFLVGNGIGVVGGTVSCDCGVQLADHEGDQLELVPILGLGDILVSEMRKHHLAEELSADFFVGHVSGDTEHRAESLAQVRSAIVLAVLLVGVVGSQEELNAVRDESVAHSLGGDTTNNGLEDLAVVGLSESLENHHNGNEVLVLAP